MILFAGSAGKRVASREAGWACITIVYVSANVQPEDVSNSYSAGADGFLPKPIDREAMVDIINEVS